MRKIITFWTLVALVGGIAIGVLADVPTSMNVQGRLTDASGAPLAPGIKQFRFKIFDAETGGEILWPNEDGEKQELSTDGNGLWTAHIGSVISLPPAIFEDTSLWLQITVDDGSNPAETFPLVKLNTGPFAFRSASSQSADVAKALVGGGSYLPLAGGAMSGPISSTGDPSITMGKGSFGTDNLNSGDWAFVAGRYNEATGPHSTIGGGYYNRAEEEYSTIGGGVANFSRAFNSTVAGGNGCDAAGNFSAIGGGVSNTATAIGACVGGGGYNRARGAYSVVAGGGGSIDADSNSAKGNYTAISGGRSNTAIGQSSFIGGGQGNTTTNDFTVVDGGFQNSASGFFGVIGGGEDNTVSGQYAMVGGGRNNKARGSHSVICGGGGEYAPGDSNLAVGICSVVPGGRRNYANGDFSFAAGFSAKALHHGAFVWADSTSGKFASTRNNQFLIRARGGVGIGTHDPGTGTALMVTDEAVGDYTEMIQFNSTELPGSQNDLLSIEAPSGSPDDFQFIECERTGDIEFRLHGNGNVTADGTITGGGADLAEMVAVTDGVQSVAPGDVMVIDSNNPRALTRSSAARSTLVAGIFSSAPGFVASPHDWDQVATERGLATKTTEGGETAIPTVMDVAAAIGEIPLAVVGIVPCRVSAENGAISPGDLLVTASTAGHAMRDDNPKAGTILGKALGALASGIGTIDVLVTLQ